MLQVLKMYIDRIVAHLFAYKINFTDQLILLEDAKSAAASYACKNRLGKPYLPVALLW